MIRRCRCPRPARWLPPAALSIAIALAVAGCGVSSESGDRPLAQNEIAYTPQPEPTTTTTTEAPPVTTIDAPATSTTVASTAVTTTTLFVAFPLDVYWIEGSMVRPIRRTDVEATLESAIEALRAGPRFTDTADGLRSAIPASDMIEFATVQSGTATITLAPSFLTLPGTEQTLAIAQIVYTVTNLPGTGLVEFRLGDRTLSVPTADGQPSRGALSRDDYVSLLASREPSPAQPIQPVTPTTTTPEVPRPGGLY